MKMPSETSPGKASNQLRFYRRKALKFTAQGLTAKGKPFKRNLSRLRADLTPKQLRALQQRKWRDRAAKNILAGLTTRGTTPKYARNTVFRLKASDAFVLVHEFDGLAAELNRCFDRLNGPAQAAVLNLSHSLSAVRNRLHRF